MCGRFTLTVNAETLKLYFNLSHHILTVPRFNIAPSQPIPVIKKIGQMDFLQWGFTPLWMEKSTPQNQKPRQFINARIESVTAKPSFKNAFQKHRLLVLADGYYEWKTLGRIKQPFYVRRKDKAPFAIAGLWEGDGALLLTTIPNSLLQSLHDRMPVLLLPKYYEDWFCEKKDSAAILQMATEVYPSHELEFFPVSTKVNKPDFDSPVCVLPLL